MADRLLHEMRRRAAAFMVALGAGLITPEAARVSRGNDKIDSATAALRADKATGPFGDRERGTIRSRLSVGLDDGAVPTILSPCAQQQARFCRSAERRRP